MRVTIPSVQYSDFLEVTLPAWRELLPEASITVVTSPEDEATQKIASLHADRVVVTGAWQSDKAQFNKAAALDHAFGFTSDGIPAPNEGEVCLSVDADVYPFGTIPRNLNGSAIYGCARYLCRTPRQLSAHKRGKLKLSRLPLMFKEYKDRPVLLSFPRPPIVRRMALSCLGYFQMWCHRSGRHRFGSYPTASTYDVEFAKRFVVRVPLTDFYVLHLGECTRRNWTGRVVARWGDPKNGVSDVFLA